MRARLLLALGVAASCFSPDPRDGLPCSQTGDCPPGQSCQIGICSSGLVADAAPLDAVAGDAALPDAPADFGPVELVPLLCPTAAACADAREPFLTADAIFFTGLAASPVGNTDIYSAVRTGPATFMQAASVGAVNTTYAEHGPFLSADGLSLWFARQDLSTGAAVRPYDQILVSTRAGGPFETARGVEGGVNTVLGDERSPQVDGAAAVMLFTRSPETAPADHDVYLARFEGGQWNTVERIDALSVAGANERSVALVEGRQAIFYIRDEQIHEALWTGEGPTAIAIDVVHDELDVAPLDVKVGVWSSPDGSEIWFDSNRSGAQQIYRAVRDPPTASGGRIRRRPIP